MRSNPGNRSMLAHAFRFFCGLVVALHLSVADRPARAEALEQNAHGRGAYDFTQRIVFNENYDIVIGAEKEKFVVYYGLIGCPQCRKFIATEIEEFYRLVSSHGFGLIVRHYLETPTDAASVLLASCGSQAMSWQKALRFLAKFANGVADTPRSYEQEVWEPLLFETFESAGGTAEQYNTCIQDTARYQFLLKNTEIIGQLNEIVWTDEEERLFDSMGLVQYPLPLPFYIVAEKISDDELQAVRVHFTRKLLIEHITGGN